MKLLFLLSFFYLNNFFEARHESLVAKNFDIKWKLVPLSNNRFSVTIDAKKEDKLLEFSNFRFIVDFYGGDGSLIATETVDYFPKPKDTEGYHLRESLSGGDETSKIFQYYHSGVYTIKGKKLQFHWYNHGVRFDPPDRNNPKPIPDDVLYGEASIGASQ